MNGNCFVDTNILVYFRDKSEPEKQKIASDWLKVIWDKQIGRTSFQVLNEYYVTVTQKLTPGLSPNSAREDVKNLMVWKPLVVDRPIVELGWELQDRHPLSWWDSLIVAAALRSGSSVLLTEDLQNGQKIQGLTIVNPFNSRAEQIIK